ncbi:site-specific integrase [Sphingomonas sanguinis]|uniref:tyrosine-type recombinase/integrase n=1 Tax=Sphingomonas sp. LC-1 TaxID=3110957 RepID=UPI0021BB77D8|nr:site-specific integrase [Sphingomonas sp. LC-1]MCT8003294.1 site-specific integrase [Sphingomonas sp. LC-1]
MASVSKRRWTKPDGTTGERWQVRYVDPATGRRPAKVFELKKDADAFKRKVEREIEDGVHTAAADSPKVETVADEFMADAARRLKDGRIGRSRFDKLELIVRRNVKPSLGHLSIRDLTHDHVRSLYDGLVRDGFTPFRARDRLIDIRQVEAFALRRRYTKTQPVADVLEELRGMSRPVIRTFEVEEVQHLLQVAGAHRHWMRGRAAALCNLMVNLAACCGLRRGEILGLTIANVDIERRIIQVRHNLTTYDELKGPKTTAGVRDVPMPRHVAALLEKWAAEHMRPDPRGLLFRTPTGNQIFPALVNQMWNKLLKDAGLDHETNGFHFHALRHFAASWMIENNLPLPEVAKLMGHSRVDMTMQVYAHALRNADARHAEMQRMADAIVPNLLTHEGRMAA